MTRRPPEPLVALCGLEGASGETLAALAREQGLAVQRLRAPGDLESLLETRGGELLLVVLGEDVPERLRVAYRVQERQEDLEVLMLCSPQRVESVEAALRLSPLLGEQVRSAGWDVRGALDLAGSAERTRARRRHRSWLEAARQSLALSQGPTRQAPVLDRLLDMAPLGVALVGERDEVLAWNGQLATMTGIREQDALGVPLPQLWAGGEELAALAREARRQRDGHAERELEEVRFGEGAAPRALRAIASRVTRPGGPGSALMVIEDVSERRRMERRAQRAEKLESLAVMAGGVAHDFNNRLQSILSSAELGASALPQDSLARQALEVVQREATAAAEVTRRLVSYTAPPSIDIEILDLNDVVRAVPAARAGAAPPEVELALELDPDCPRVCGDASQLQEVVAALLGNAFEAAGPGGAVRISTSASHGHREARAEEGRETPEGPCAELVVSDTGPGMEPAVRERAFEPFFTTRGPGRGLGLAAAQGILRAHGGTIHLESTPGTGTRARVLLPARAPVPDAPRGRWIAPRPEGAAASLVLVVDDAPEIRELLSEFLQQSGHRAVAVGDGEAALALLEREGDRVALVLLDLTMPVLDGPGTLRRLRRTRPDLPVVLMSGYDGSEAAGRLGELRTDGFLQKPFRLVQLQAELRRLLDRSD